MADSDHNKRIAAKREKGCLDFMQTTNSNLITAKHYMKLTSYDIERAISLFYDNGGEEIITTKDDDDDNGNNNNNNNEDNNKKLSKEDKDDEINNNDPISLLMNSVKKKESSDDNDNNSSSVSPYFKSPGRSLNSSAAAAAASGRSTDDGNSSLSPPKAMKVRVVFYKNGFTASADDDDGNDEKEKYAPARRGIHTFANSSNDDKNNEPLLPPFRDYNTTENKQFVLDVQNNIVPIEFRKYDDVSRQPIPVTILLGDLRKKDYPIDIWKKQKQRRINKNVNKSSSSFGGGSTGHTLGGGGGSGGGATEGNNNNRNIRQNTNDDSFFTDICNRLWLLICLIFEIIVSYLKVVKNTISPPKKHIVDNNKDKTIISIRLPPSIITIIKSTTTNNNRYPSSGRLQVEFNTDHTIIDLKRYCEIELSTILSKREINNILPSSNYYSTKKFDLISGFPPKSILIESNNDNKTLKDANLLNAIVEIRLLQQNTTSTDKKRR